MAHTHTDSCSHETTLAKVKATDRLSPVKVRLTVELPEAVVKERETKAVARYRNQAKIPGFRPGKVPEKIVRQKFSDEIKRDVFSNLLEEGLASAIQETKLMPVSRPSVNFKGKELTLGQALEFEAEFEVRPEFEVEDKNYKNILLEEKALKVEDKDVDDAVENIRKRFAALEPALNVKVEKGQYAIVKIGFEIHDDPPKKEEPKEFTLELGAGDLLPELENGILGMEVGNKKKISATFPKDYHDKNLANKKADFDVELLEIKRLALPELNDAFAEQVQKGKTLLALRGDIRKELEHQKKAEADDDKKRQILEHVVKKHTFDIPQSMVDERMAAMQRSMEEDQKRRGINQPLNLEAKEIAMLRERAEFQVRASLILSKVAVKESIQLDETFVEHRIQEIAKGSGKSVDETRNWLNQQGIIDRIREEKLTSQVFDFLIKNAKTKANGAKS